MKNLLSEAERLAQGGMGYLQFHAALTWMRQLAEVAASQGKPARFIGDPDVGWVDYQVWDYGDFCLSFDLRAHGHLLISLDSAVTFYGMDMTFYPANAETWDMILRRVDAIRRGARAFKPVPIRR